MAASLAVLLPPQNPVRSPCARPLAPQTSSSATNPAPPSAGRPRTSAPPPPTRTSAPRCGAPTRSRPSTGASRTRTRPRSSPPLCPSAGRGTTAGRSAARACPGAGARERGSSGGGGAAKEAGEAERVGAGRRRPSRGRRGGTRRSSRRTRRRRGPEARGEGGGSLPPSLSVASLLASVCLPRSVASPPCLRIVPPFSPRAHICSFPPSLSPEHNGASRPSPLCRYDLLHPPPKPQCDNPLPWSAPAWWRESELEQGSSRTQNGQRAQRVTGAAWISGSSLRFVIEQTDRANGACRVSQRIELMKMGPWRGSCVRAAGGDMRFGEPVCGASEWASEHALCLDQP